MHEETNETENTLETTPAAKIAIAPEDLDPDAKRVSELTSEIMGILQRRNWPGSCLTICDSSPETSACYGFNHLNSKEQFPLIMSAGMVGMKLVQICHLLDGD